MEKALILYEKCDLEKNRWFVKRCAEVFLKYGLGTDVITDEEFDRVIEETSDVRVVINRSRNYHISQEFEKKGIRVFNTSFVTEVGNDKWKMYEFARQHDIAVIETDNKLLEYPAVMKSRYGHGGTEVYLLENKKDLEKWQDKTDGKEKYIYQRFAKTGGVDIRVYVLGDEIVAAVKRQAVKDFRSNYSLGGCTAIYELSSEEREFVNKISEILRPDYVGIDIMYDGDRLVLNEVEDAAGARMLYQNSDLDIIGMFAEYVIKSI